MNPKNTWLLLGVALLLFAFIYFFERHFPVGSSASHNPAGGLLTPWTASDVEKVQVFRNQLQVTAEKNSQGWNLVTPMAVPAQASRVEALLQALAGHAGPPQISVGVVAETPGGSADFGMEDPAAVVVLHQGDQRIELRVGSSTAPGDQLYVQRVGVGGIFVVSADLLEQLPTKAGDWRNRRLLSLDRRDYNRLEVRRGGLQFGLEQNSAGTGWQLKPRQMKADSAKVNQFLNQLHEVQVFEFLENPEGGVESLGLQTPTSELVFRRGNTEVLTLQIGGDYAGNTNLVYGRLGTPGQLVVLPRLPLEPLQVPADHWLDRRPFAFNPAEADRITFRGISGFKLQRQANGGWAVVEPEQFPADREAVVEMLGRLAQSEVVAFTRDVVADPAEFGLAPPALEILIRKSAPVATDPPPLLQHLQLGLKDEKVYARSAGADPVYELNRQAFENLPAAAWQLRERTLWSLSTNEIVRVVVTQKEQKREWIRGPKQNWVLAPGSQGIFFPEAFEEALFRLGRLQASAWLARGEQKLKEFGFDQGGHQIVLEAQKANGREIYKLDLAVHPESGYPYGLVRFGGEPWVFLFPPDLYYGLISPQLSLPTAAALNGP